MANSWKKYGGIYKSDKYNSIGVGTMVADQVLIRQRVITSSQVGGSLTVGENVEIGIDLTVKNNTSISGDLYLQQSEYVGDKVYFNIENDIYRNFIGYISGNSKLGRIGIGTTVPTSFLDINVSNSVINSGEGGSTIGNTITDVLTIRNSNNYIRNIIAQNVHKSGVVVDTIGNIASVGFYKGNIDVSASIPTISMIADTSNHIFTINSTNNKIISNATTISSETITTISSNNDNTIISKNNTNISSGTNTIVKTVNDLIIDTSNNAVLNTSNDFTLTTGNISNINSIMSISKRINNGQLLNGTITIYDNSATVFLNDYYNRDTVKSGNAITIVSNDNSSNAFINIVTPQQNGLYIGGGAYPLDTTRSMGTIGISRTDVSYIPTQVIVSNTGSEYAAKYRSTIGFNTYSPESNKYVVDINGPTRIGNGEMHIRAHANFQQSSVHFSKQNKKFGVIFGSPYKYESINQLHTYNILITNDNGVTWTTTDTLEQLTFGTTLYDRLYAYCTNENEFFYISTLASATIGYGKVNAINNARSLSNINYSLYTSESGRSFKTLCVSAPQPNNYKILIGGSYTNGTSKSVIYYYNVTSSLSANSLANPNIIDASCSNIRHSDIDYNNNIAYFVGDGIEKIDFTSTTPTSALFKNTGVYSKVFVYDDNYVVAMGDNIISYTHNGGNTWTDVSINNFNNEPYPSDKPYPNFKYNDSYESFTITYIALIDNMNGIATGTFADADGINQPLIICTKDGSNTWSRMNPKTFYSSGVGEYIENVTLNCIVPTSKDNYVIVNNIINSSTNPFISGNSDIIYGYLPNLFNVFTNQVVDVNGGMNVDGKIWQF